ncbi:MAG: DUF4271 domain-containing protein [Niabella sp.]
MTLFLVLILMSPLQAQPLANPRDTLPQSDSTLSLLQKPPHWDLQQRILQNHPYFNFSEKPMPMLISKRTKRPGKEIYFYAIAGLALLFAGFRTAFEKYFNDLRSLFFRTTLKQRQLRQQLTQASLPSLLLNLFYVLVMGFYLTLLFTRNTHTTYSFWLICGYATSAVAIIYLFKFLLLKFMGWMFQWQTPFNDYIFIVFFINKVISIFLLPVVVLATLGSPWLQVVTFTLSWIGLAVLYVYRFSLATSIIRKLSAFSIWHFLLYLVALEILPILVIYKAIAIFLK